MRVMPRVSFRGATAVLALTAAALIGATGVASACNTGDNRPHPVPGKKPTPCAENQSGITQDDVDFEGGKGTKGLTIKAVHDGVKVTRIVVLGGNDGYNEYVPGKTGKGGEVFSPNAPWTDLVAPFNYGGNRAPNIDDWFLCGTKEKTKPPTETTKPSKPTETAKPTETTSAPSSSATSTSPAAVPAGNESGGSGGGLANTGFDNGFLVWIAGLLLLGGGGLLALLKFRRKASE